MFYPLICNKCSHTWEVQWTISDYDEKLSREKCPNCKSKKVQQNYQNKDFLCTISNRTLGTLAESNNKKLGSYGLEKQRHDHNAKKNEGKLQLLKEKGVISQDATELPNLKKPYGEMDKEVKKKIFSGSPEEQKNKINKYIKDGNV